MGNELRQAYKAVCSTITAQTARLISVDKKSKVAVYCEADGNSFAFEITNGEFNPLRASKDTTVKVEKETDSISVFYTAESASSIISVKTQLIYGHVSNFLSALPPSSTAEEEKIFNVDYRHLDVLELGNIDSSKSYKTAKSKNKVINTISTSFEDTGSSIDQKLTVPGGIDMSSSSGNFNTITAKEIIVGTNKDGTITVNGNISVSGDIETTETTLKVGQMNIKDFVKNIIEKEYLYNGVYEQNAAA